MEKKNTVLVVLVVILSLLVGALGGYLISNKLVNNSNNTNQTEKPNDQNQDNITSSDNKNLYAKINDAKNGDGSNLEKAYKIINLINEAGDWKSTHVACSNNNKDIVCNIEFDIFKFIDGNINGVQWDVLYLDFQNEEDLAKLINSKTSSHYRILLKDYDEINNAINDALNNDTYCVGYSFDDNYFYYDFYSGTSARPLWYALDPYTGKCSLGNQKHEFSYKINRKDLSYEKIVLK